MGYSAIYTRRMNYLGFETVNRVVGRILGEEVTVEEVGAAISSLRFRFRFIGITLALLASALIVGSLVLAIFTAAGAYIFIMIGPSLIMFALAMSSLKIAQLLQKREKE
jgi:hypothetical protein